MVDKRKKCRRKIKIKCREGEKEQWKESGTNRVVVVVEGDRKRRNKGREVMKEKRKRRQ